MAHKKDGHHGHKGHRAHAKHHDHRKHMVRSQQHGPHHSHHDEGDVEEGMGTSPAGTQFREGKRYYGAGHGDFANMPREVRMEMYPKDHYGVGVEYADNYDRINNIEGGSDRNMRSQMSREMY